MNRHTDSITIIRDASGKPAFVVLPFSEYQAMKLGKPSAFDDYIPSQVVDFVLDNQVSAARGWREYLGFTQSEIAQRIGITQSAYAQLEAKKVLRKKTREKTAKAFGILPEQLDF
ncbi:MAG: helix-turn-helix domain-containing protein [Burkholderiaceae bacterium]|jgi:DNA-binding XRE family transcriptional regulator|nr:helix-turn-helix domain-containing protein [Burkholderiaceae bacterium]